MILKTWGTKQSQLTKKLKQKTLIMMSFANSDKNDACQNTLILLLLLMILMISYVYWIVVLIAYKWYKEMVLFTLMTQTHRLPSVYMLGHPGDVMVRSSPAPISMIPPHSVDQEKTVIIPSYICIKLLNQHVIFQNMRKRLQLSISLIFEDINNLKLVLFWIATIVDFKGYRYLWMF